MKKILITGANSYIGMSFEKWVLERYPDEFLIDTVDMTNDGWKEKKFAGYDAVLHVAGIAHRKETRENAFLYYKVNRDLAIETAKKAKKESVKQFILLSTMSVYGKVVGKIRKDDKPDPKNHYGKAKWQADKTIERLADEDFKVVILRPPMVYGEGCKGNYQLLRKFALKSPVFPAFQNQRSMVHVEKLAEFVAQVIMENKRGLFFPQDENYVCTSQMVKEIAGKEGKKIRMVVFFNPFIKVALKLKVRIIQKVFGDLVYEK